MNLWRKMTLIVGLAMIALIFQNCGNLESIDLSNEELTSLRNHKANVASSSSEISSLTMSILQRLGVKAAIDSDLVAEIQQSVSLGDFKAAALRAVEEDSFYNITMRDFAARMSNREELTNVGLNDFIATFIGVARDNKDSRELLTGDYYYWAPAAGTGVGVDEEMDVVPVSYTHLTLPTTPYV